MQEFLELLDIVLHRKYISLQVGLMKTPMWPQIYCLTASGRKQIPQCFSPIIHWTLLRFFALRFPQSFGPMVYNAGPIRLYNVA